MNNEPLTFDIETLPTKDKQVIERIASTIRPPGNIKKKEAIVRLFSCSACSSAMRAEVLGILRF